MVAAAVIGIGSAVVGGVASNKAAKKQASSAAAAGAQQQQQFDASSAAAERQQAQSRADTLAQQERVRMDTIAQNRQVRTDTIAQNQQFRNDTQQTRDAGSFALDAMTVGMGGGRRVLRQPPPGTSATEIEAQRQKDIVAQREQQAAAAQQAAAQQAAAQQAAAQQAAAQQAAAQQAAAQQAASKRAASKRPGAPDPREDLVDLYQRSHNMTRQEAESLADQIYPAGAATGDNVSTGAIPTETTKDMAFMQSALAQLPAAMAGDIYGGGSGEMPIPREAYYEIDPSTATGKGEFNTDFSMADFQKDPGYDFRMAEGRRALEGSAVARGGLLSGGTLKALTRYGQDAGSAEYGNAYQRYNADRDRRFNRLATIAGTGQTATANTGNNSSSALNQINQAGANATNQINSSGNQAIGNINQGAANTTTNLAQMGQANSNAQGSALMQAGNASASGIMGVSNAITSGANGFMNYRQGQQMLNTMSPVNP